MRKIAAWLGIVAFAAPLILAGCTGGGAPAFPNLGILKREPNTSLSAEQQQKAIAELEAEQKKNKAAQTERR